MKLWIQSTLLTALALTYSGCGSTPKPQEETKTDKTLPIIHFTQNSVFSDMNEIAFEWKPITNANVEGVYIYKTKVEFESKKQKLHYYKTIDNRFSTHFVDDEVVPNTKYIYLFKTFVGDSESIGSKIDAKSLPLLNSVTWIHSITGMPRSAKIIWRPHTNQKVETYLIERKREGDEKFKQIDEIKGRLNAEFIDTDLDDNSIYYYRIRVKTFDGLISHPSQTVKAVTKELPESIKNITATNDLVKKIIISWTPTNIKDFKYYNIYRSNDKNSNYKLFKKTKIASCVDKLDKDGKKYFYRVSVVDKDDLESLYSQTTTLGMSLSKPLAPEDVSAKLLDRSIEIEWNDKDPRVKSYIVERKEKDGWFKYRVKAYKNIKSTSFKDSSVEVDKEYKYSVFAVDANGVISERSKEVMVETSQLQTVMKIDNGRTVMTVAPQKKETQTIPTVTTVDDLEVEEN